MSAVPISHIQPDPIPFDGIPRIAHSAIRQAPDTWRKWLAFCEATEDHDFEMTCEEAAEMFSMVATLVQLGVPFAPDFLARVEALRQAAINHPFGVSFLEDDTDSDEDGLDDVDGGDDGDEDGSDSHIEDGWRGPCFDHSTPESAAASKQWWKENMTFDSDAPRARPKFTKATPDSVVFPEPEFQQEAR